MGGWVDVARARVSNFDVCCGRAGLPTCMVLDDDFLFLVIWNTKYLIARARLSARARVRARACVRACASVGAQARALVHAVAELLRHVVLGDVPRCDQCRPP